MPSTVYLWHKAPFVRLLPPFMAGIILQWYVQLPTGSLAVCFFAFSTAVVIYSFLSLNLKYRLAFANGAILNMLLIVSGAFAARAKDIRNQEDWIGHYCRGRNYVVVTLDGPLVEKTNSYKALATPEFIFTNDTWRKTKGKIIIYFKKDPACARLHYGSRIIFSKPLQEIKNAGNPGSFDYKRYSLFQGITHQVYVTVPDFRILGSEQKNFFDEGIFNSRSWVIGILRRFISGDQEQGLAEALLIGYKDDLDKNLVQSYANTGVVHVIAISGLHLGLIYWLLLGLTKFLKRNKKFVWLRLLIIISSLWLFSLLAGGQPSVLRSAVMFTCMAFGEVIARRASIYNTLAFSAFLLLCYNPYWLWDVGFQLSYAAVLSIVIFFKPIYNWFYFPNKIIDFIWKLNAVTLAAQLLTLPLSIYHFHQMPVLFLFTNLVAVPLSSIILIGEIVLCTLFFIEPLAHLTGSALHGLIWFMNTYIRRLDQVSFSVWDGLSISVLQAVFLTAAVMMFCYGLMEKKMKAWRISATCLLLFLLLRSLSFIAAYQQKKLIVYNIPKHLAVDMVSGRSLNFIGDTGLLEDDFIRNFYIRPSRVLHRIVRVQTVEGSAKEFDVNHKHIAILDSSYQFLPCGQKERLDILILSRNLKLSISGLTRSFTIGQIVIAGPVPAWKARLWKKDCDSLHISCYDVSEKGAFVMNL